MKKRLLTISLTLLLLIGSTAPAFANSDSLITDPYSRYAKAIRYLEDKGAIQGYAQGGGFREDQLVTLAEFWTLIIKSTIPDLKTEDVTPTHPFKDIPLNHWATPYVQRAWEEGLLTETESFGLNATVTRVEGARAALNLLELPIPKKIPSHEVPLPLRDVTPTSRFAPLVHVAIKNNLMTPLDEKQGYFRPLKTMSRGEAALLAYNMDIHLLGSRIFENTTELEGDLAELGLRENLPHLDIFADVWSRIEQKYFNSKLPDGPNKEALMYDAIKGLVEGLDDPHSVFFDPPESEQFDEYLEGSFGGIGAEVNDEEEGIVIKSFTLDSPAEKAGLQVYDRIIKVNDESVEGKSARDAVQKIRGEIGTQVKITVIRTGNSTPLTFTITRAIINIGYIKGSMMGKALYLDLNLFTELSFVDFTQTINRLMEENPDFTGLILDLRNNPGGYLESAKSMIGHFIPHGNVVVWIQTGPKRSAMHMSTGKGEWADVPVVILLNQGSASASEIMALALFEKSDAHLVGETTYGKGTVQELIDYQDGSSLKLTVAEWRSPEYHSINGIGITPMTYVENTPDDLKNGRDPQLEAALKELEMMVGTLP